VLERRSRGTFVARRPMTTASSLSKSMRPMPLRQADRLARRDQRRGRLEEHQRLGREGLLLLGGVVAVVQADRDDLRRLHGRQQARPGRQREPPPGADLLARPELAEQVALEQGKPPSRSIR
jgi:hypothetical protein